MGFNSINKNDKINEAYEKVITESDKTKMENLVRDHLSGTDRKIDKKIMFGFIKSKMKKPDEKLFSNVWKELIDDDFLIKAGKNTYKWER